MNGECNGSSNLLAGGWQGLDGEKEDELHPEQDKVAIGSFSPTIVQSKKSQKAKSTFIETKLASLTVLYR